MTSNVRNRLLKFSSFFQKIGQRANKQILGLKSKILDQIRRTSIFSKLKNGGSALSKQKLFVGTVLARQANIIRRQTLANDAYVCGFCCMATARERDFFNPKDVGAALCLAGGASCLALGGWCLLGGAWRCLKCWRKQI